MADPAIPSFSAASAADLRTKLADIDIKVPLRTEGRTTAHCERWSGCRMLAAYSQCGELSYPLQLESRDRPDLLLTFGGRQIGVEITEATPTDWARADALREHMDEDKVILISEFSPTDASRSLEDVRAIARGEAPGDGWAGNAPERQWAEAMLHVAKQKAAKMSKPGYQRFDEDWVLIYDDWPLPNVDLREASALLLEHLKAENPRLPFHRIVIESGDEIVTFSGDEFTIKPIPKLWSYE